MTRARPRRVVALVVATALMLAGGGGAAAAPASVSSAAQPSPAPPSDTPGASAAGWTWPVNPPTIVSPWAPPAHAYGPGHRGIDLRVDLGATVASPAAGVVAFAGTVVDRSLVTIDHGGGPVTTLEPVVATVVVGTVIAAGEAVGTVDAGGHSPLGAVHFGVRQDGEYINPMQLLGGIPRAVLLPCC